jgi:hypothetical protein
VAEPSPYFPQTKTGILRQNLRIGAALNTGVMGNEFAYNRFISERVFRLRVALYAALLVAVTTAFGRSVAQTETEISWKANSAGTLIFGIPGQTERYANYFAYQSHQTPGALTFRPYSAFDFGRELNRRELNNQLPARALDLRIAGLISARTLAPGVNELGVSGRGGLGITPMQIAVADQSAFVDEEITPASEAATWFAAALVAVLIAWHQRRRFTRILKHRIQSGLRALVSS